MAVNSRTHTIYEMLRSAGFDGKLTLRESDPTDTTGWASRDDYIIYTPNGEDDTPFSVSCLRVQIEFEYMTGLISDKAGANPKRIQVLFPPTAPCRTRTYRMKRNGTWNYAGMISAFTEGADWLLAREKLNLMRQEKRDKGAEHFQTVELPEGFTVADVYSHQVVINTPKKGWLNDWRQLRFPLDVEEATIDFQGFSMPIHNLPQFLLLLNIEKETDDADNS